MHRLRFKQMQLGVRMKDVRYEWCKKTDREGDDVLSIISWSTGLEIAQLRRLHDFRFWRVNFPSAYSKNVWSFRATHYSDEELVKHFGENWEQETYRGFQTIIDFKLWLQDRRYKGNVS